MEGEIRRYEGKAREGALRVALSPTGMFECFNPRKGPVGKGDGKSERRGSCLRQQESSPAVAIEGPKLTGEGNGCRWRRGVPSG